MNYSAEYSCTRAGIGDILRDGIAGSVGWSVFNWIRLLSKAVIPVYALTCSVYEFLMLAPSPKLVSVQWHPNVI